VIWFKYVMTFSASNLLLEKEKAESQTHNFDFEDNGIGAG